MTDKHNFKIGDKVFKHRHGGSYVALRVTGVKQYKVRCKVTTDDGSEWDADGRPWSRDDPWNTSSLLPFTEEIQAEMDHECVRAIVRWVDVHFDALPPAHQSELGALAQSIHASVTASEEEKP